MDRLRRTYRSRWTVWALGSLALLSAACGTRVERASGETGTPQALGTGAPGATLDGSGTTAGPSAGADPGAPTTPGAAPAPGAGPTAGPTVGGEAPAPGAPAQGSPIVIGNVGTYSGPAGVVFNPFKDGAQLWVKHVNARGGVNGHEVRLLVYDDGGDPARHRAQVQEAVEQRNVIAFLMNGDVIAGQSSVEYITQKRVPVVGTDTGTNIPYTSPMYFPSSSSGDFTYQAIVFSAAEQLKPLGKTKVGTLVCVEAQACAGVEEGFATHAARAGLKHVYRGRASLAQPDFTAECLSAKNAGVEMLWAAMDQNSMGRIAAACARQGFRPLYGAGSQNTSDSLRSNDAFEGLIGTAFTFPYFQTGTPAADEFHAALDQYGDGIEVGLSTAGGWVGGKLFEKAAANLPEPATREALLAGLWSIKNDTLGGLTQPLTFVQDKPPTGRACWYNFTIKDGEFRSPDRFALRCA